MNEGRPVANKPTQEEWEVFTVVETFWHEKKFFPGTEEISKRTNFSQENISIILESDRAKRRFEMLGIDVNAVPLAKRGELKRNQTGLTDKQLAVAEVVLNPFDKRGHNAKLKSLGVLPVTYNGWRSNKTFSDYFSQRAHEMFGDAMPLAEEALVRKMMTGDTSAIKLYMEIQGRYTKNAVPTQDFRMLVLRLIEILQLHIKDPALLQLISHDVKELVEPTPPSQFTKVTEGEIVYDGDDAPIRS